MARPTDEDPEVATLTEAIDIHRSKAAAIALGTAKDDGVNHTAQVNELSDQLGIHLKRKKGAAQ